MKRLDELPYRFWPPRSLPAGVEAPTKVVNLASAKFKPIYAKVVNPTLKAMGFRCAGSTATRFTERLWSMVWFGTSKWGGSGEVVIASHLGGMLSREERVVTPETFTYVDALFMRPLLLSPGVDMFDLGRNEDEARETATYMLEAFEVQGRPHLTALSGVEDLLLSLDVGGWEAPMAAYRETYGMRLHPPREAAALLIGRLNARAGRVDKAKAFAEDGLATLNANFGEYRRTYYQWVLRFENLLAGDWLYVVDDAGRAEADRRVEAEQAS